MQRFLTLLFPTCNGSPQASFVLLVLRLCFGTLLLTHGLAKVTHYYDLVDTFPDPIGLGSRASLLLAIFAELFCAAGCILGLLFRPAMIPIVLNMAVAFFVVHRNDPLASKELALCYLVIFTMLLITGPGRFALDEWIARRLRG